MISERLSIELSKQFNAELYSSYFYLAMAGWLSRQGLSGFENWMKCQAQEEMDHAVKFFNYINERGGTVLLEAIDKPPQDWETPRAVFKDVCDHEAHVTSLINKLMCIAVEEKDFAAQAFLQWFITEQVEEEASVGDVHNKLQLIGDAQNGLFLLDREMEKRVFTPAPTTGE